MQYLASALQYGLCISVRPTVGAKSIDWLMHKVTVPAQLLILSAEICMVDESGVLNITSAGWMHCMCECQRDNSNRESGWVWGEQLNKEYNINDHFGLLLPVLC